MNSEEILIAGDTVFWTDPDDSCSNESCCSREGRIKALTYEGDAVTITWDAGDDTGALLTELEMVEESSNVVVFSVRQGVISDERIPHGIKVILKDYDFGVDGLPEVRKFDNVGPRSIRHKVSLACLGGVIELESELPVGVRVRIFDYDTEGMDESELDAIGNETVNIYDL